jgi:hypothetical protein
MVSGSPRVLQLLPPLKLVAMILLKVALNTINKIKSHLSQVIKSQNKIIYTVVKVLNIFVILQ